MTWATFCGLEKQSLEAVCSSAFLGASQCCQTANLTCQERKKTGQTCSFLSLCSTKVLPGKQETVFFFSFFKPNVGSLFQCLFLFSYEKYMLPVGNTDGAPLVNLWAPQRRKAMSSSVRWNRPTVLALLACLGLFKVLQHLAKDDYVSDYLSSPSSSSSSSKQQRRDRLGEASTSDHYEV